MRSLILLSFLLITDFSLSTAQPNVHTKIPLGSRLSSNNNASWQSNSARFAFGFYTQGDGTSSVAIWWVGTQPKTVAWTANSAPSGDRTLSLNATGLLLSEAARGTETAIAKSSRPVAYASMLDSGNFVLYGENSDVVWQSFDYPTDTLLPGQQLPPGNRLVSAASETNGSVQRYQLVMQTDGNLVQYPIISSQLLPYHAYWLTQTNGQGENVRLNFDSDGQLYLRNSSNDAIFRFPVEPKSGGMLRFTLDSDGILRLYELSSGQARDWSVLWASVDKCAPVGLCGENSYCSALADDQGTVCTCLPGFNYIDQEHGEKRLGCRRESGACTNTTEKIEGFLWENSAYSSLSNVSEGECEAECSRDCNCEVAQYWSGQCSKLSLPLKFSKRGDAVNLATIVKVQAPVTASKGRDMVTRRDNAILISGIAMSSFGLVALVVAIALVCRFQMWKYHKVGDKSSEEYLGDIGLRAYAFVELEKATDGFSDEVGRGAFGTVFRGTIGSRSSKKVVAVKRLEIVSADGEREFSNEMKVIGKTHHKNLLKLLGYCHEGSHRLLVYEFMENGSLADSLFDSDVKPGWEDRMATALDVARGILYLHEECETQIIHCDIKPENILIDEQNCAKIADFGLAKLLMPDQTRTFTGLRGTRGYVAPEWHKNMRITAKVDVYSFGIVLLEMACCRRSVEMDVPEERVVLANWVFECLMDGEVEKLVGEEEGVEREEVRRVIKIGLWCIQEDPSLRPSINKVCLMLEGTIQTPHPPNPTSSITSINIA